jgi:flagellar assembly factor FliW
MTVMTKAYGPMEADERQRISFPKGLLGFDSLKEFALLNAKQEPFYYLQSLEDADVAFILIDPFIFRPDFEIDVSDEDLMAIGVSAPEEGLVLAIVTVPKEGAPVTANLMGPLIIGRKSRLGFQAVLNDPRWLTKHDIMGEMARTGKGPC